MTADWTGALARQQSPLLTARSPTAEQEKKVKNSLMQRRSVIGHSGLPFNCPHTEEIAHEIIDSLELKASSRVLDLGCGRAELLTRVVESFGCTGIGVDKSKDLLNMARQSSRGSVQLIEKEMLAFLDENDLMFDLIICIGSIPHGAQEETIRKMATLLNGVGSVLLIGELVWIKQPSPFFLEHLEIKESDYVSQDVLLSICNRYNMQEIYTNRQGLQNYEMQMLNNIENWASMPENRADPDREFILQKSREWNNFSAKNAWETWEFFTVMAKLT